MKLVLIEGIIVFFIKKKEKKTPKPELKAFKCIQKE